MKNDCYYFEMEVCTCRLSEYCDKYCPGTEGCGQYVSESEYFSNMIAGNIRQESSTETAKERNDVIRKRLSPGKTKKQLKHERKAEEAKLGDGTGYSLKDDPRFKGMFGGK